MKHRWRFRSTWLGKLVLQRLDTWPSDNPTGCVNTWRDATTEDLIDFIKENHP